MGTHSFKMIAICIAILSCAQVKAQDWETKDWKRWSDGPLESSDFLKRSSADTNKIGILSCVLDYNTDKQKIGNLKFEAVNTWMTMDKLDSWYDPALVSDLKYFQARFDLLEALRRQMQNEINNDPAHTNDIINYYGRLIDSRIDAFCEECKYGKDKEAVDSLAADISKTLADTQEEPHKAPVIDKKGLGATFFLGYSGEMYQGAVGSGIPYLNNIVFGTGLYYGSAGVTLNFCPGFGSALKTSDFYYDEIHDYSWVRGRAVQPGSINVLAEYRIFDSNYFAIAPFAGCGVGFLDQDTQVKGETGSTINSEISGLRLSAGLKLSYKIIRTIDLGQEYAERNLDFILYGASTNFKGLGQCYSFNFGIYYDITCWLTKLK